MKRKSENHRKSLAKRIFRTFAGILLAAAVLLSGVLIFAAVYAERHLDFTADEALFSAAKEGNLTVYLADGSWEEGYQPTEIGRDAGSAGEKEFIPLAEIAPVMKEGILAAEDRRFYEHHGVNFLRTGYALWNAVFHTKPTFGASTVTQQVVKNISGDSEVTVKRKWNEILRAMELEKRHTKDEILEVYLNLLPMSENCIGVSSAAQTYFGKDASDLTAGEAALLIGMTNAPTRYNPYLHPDAALEKRNSVLAVMRDCGVISAEEYERASGEELGVRERSEKEKTPDNWFVETVREEVIADLMKEKNMSRSAAAKLFDAGGLTVETTESAKVQSLLEAYFENAGHFPEAVNHGLQYAMVITDPNTGDLLGIVGSQGKKQAERILNFATALHTPGSVLKPLALYAPLLDQKAITPATVFDDVPISFYGGTPYPQNSPNRYDGLTTVKDALRLSKNTVAMRLYAMRGAEAIYHDLRYSYGFDSLVRREGSITDLAPSPLALGQLSYGVSLRRLTEAYGVFPSEGRLSRGRSYRKVTDSRGNVLLEKLVSTEQILKPETARIMNQLLTGVVDSGTAKQITLKESVDTAGKTGTSGGDKDRLFIGYTPYLCAGIWCGYEDGGRAVGNHVKNHLTVWDGVMTALHQKLLSGLSEREIRHFSVQGLVRANFCRDSGECYSPVCTLDARGGRMDSAWFYPDTVPKTLCSRHIEVNYDFLTEGVAGGFCPAEDCGKAALLDIPDRSFPMEIPIADAQYVYRRLPEGLSPCEDYTKPYFQSAIPDGVYIGRCGDAMQKQFNSWCYLHDSGEEEDSEEEIGA